MKEHNSINRFYFLTAFFLVTLIYWSCHNETSRKQAGKSVPNDSFFFDTLTFTNDSAIKQKVEIDQKTKNTSINFNELSVSINRLVLFDESTVVNETQKDTVYLYGDIGQTIENQSIIISTSLLVNLQVDQRYETSVTIMDDGPHCDLVNWKHYLSDWKPLKATNENTFTGHSYSEEESHRFPVIPITELREEVKNHCGDRWTALIASIKSPTAEPAAVGISRYFLRIRGKRSDNNLTITKYIVLEVAMVC